MSTRSADQSPIRRPDSASHSLPARAAKFGAAFIIMTAIWTVVGFILVELDTTALGRTDQRWNDWVFLVTASALELGVYGAVSRIVGRQRRDR